MTNIVFFLLLALAFSAQAQLDVLVADCKSSTNADCLVAPKECLTDDTPCLGVLQITNGTFLSTRLNVATKSGYVAVGFSDDKKMGNEVTADCIKLDGVSNVFPGNNAGHKHTQEEQKSDGIRIITTFTNDTDLTCIYEISDEFTSGNFSLTFGKPYFLLLAVGPVEGKVMKYHETKAVAEETHIFSSGNLVTSSTMIFFIFVTTISSTFF